MKLRELKDGICECGFQFAKPGELRNAQAYRDENFQWYIICPKCKREYDTD